MGRHNMIDSFDFAQDRYLLWITDYVRDEVAASLRSSQWQGCRALLRKARNDGDTSKQDWPFDCALLRSGRECFLLTLGRRNMVKMTNNTWQRAWKGIGFFLRGITCRQPRGMKGARRSREKDDSWAGEQGKEEKSWGDERRDEVRHRWVKLIGGGGGGRIHIKNQTSKCKITKKISKSKSKLWNVRAGCGLGRGVVL